VRIAVSRAPGAERVVTPIELFFDLVYVFALGDSRTTFSSTSICGRAPRR
jgi:low temperature requirement protein LtrA